MLNSARQILTPLVVALCVALSGVPASADVIKPVDCKKTPKAPQCTVKVGNPSTGGGNNSGSNDGSDDDDGSGDGTWDGCTYQPAEGDLAPPAGKTADDGGWYVEVCIIGDGKGGPQVSDPIWIDGPGPTVDPAVLGRQAVALLTLPQPAIRLNPKPPALQVAYFPTWLWLDSSSWTSQTATASVPGLSVTAVATPSKLVFSPGDGSSTVVCSGRGTAWNSGLDPDDPSPTCGHTYSKVGAFTVTATVTWQVSWSGGGQTGTVPDLTTTSAQTLTVTDSQGLNTTTRG